MFENMWLTDPSCQDTVSAAWTSVSSPNTVENMLSSLEKCISWSRINTPSAMWDKKSEILSSNLNHNVMLLRIVKHRVS